MSKFQKIETGEIVEANSFTELFAFTHNSNYVPVEVTGVNESDITNFSKKELIKYLSDLNIDFDKKMSKEELLSIALNDTSDNENLKEIDEEDTSDDQNAEELDNA